MTADPNCLHCDEPVLRARAEWIRSIEITGAQNRALHPECLTRMVIGGLNHLAGRCFCCGGNEPPDPPEMTPHQAAIAAVAYWQQRH